MISLPKMCKGTDLSQREKPFKFSHGNIWSVIQDEVRMVGVEASDGGRVMLGPRFDWSIFDWASNDAFISISPPPTPNRPDTAT